VKASKPVIGADMTLTGCVLTLDEAEHLPGCLASLSWVDQLLVIDSGSTDATRVIARSAGAEVVVQTFENFSRQRQRALELIGSDWVLFLDADERIPPALATEIRRALGTPGVAGYWIPRENVFWGRTLRGGGWWPDPQMRLMRTALARYDPDRAVHEVAEVAGPSACLTRPMTHINYESPAEFRAKQAAYVRLEVRLRRAIGDKVRPHHVVSQPLRELHRRFIGLKGWRDGWLGAWLALQMAYAEAVVQLELLGLRTADR